MAMPNKDRESIQPAENLKPVVRHIVPAAEWVSHWRSTEMTKQAPCIEVDTDPDGPADSLVSQEVTIKTPDGRCAQYISETPIYPIGTRNVSGTSWFAIAGFISTGVGATPYYWRSGASPSLA
jgi:hypothetical protein